MDNICSICFENHEQNNCEVLGCGHQFHRHCLQQWVNYSTLRGSDNLSDTIVSFAKCPYCRFPILSELLPSEADCFYKFYHFTRFVRQKCSYLDCNFSEFPLNHGICSKHRYPDIDRNDLNIIMDQLSCFHFLPLFARKQLLFFAVVCFSKNVDFVQEFSALKNDIIQLLTNPEKKVGYEVVLQKHVVDAIQEFCRMKGHGRLDQYHI